MQTFNLLIQISCSKWISFLETLPKKNVQTILSNKENMLQSQGKPDNYATNIEQYQWLCSLFLTSLSFTSPDSL